MAGTGDNLDSLRPSRIQGERIMLALAISIFVHLLIWTGYELNRDWHWTQHVPWLSPKPITTLRIVPVEQPLEFVTVDTPSPQAPQRAKYISNKNSVAADNSAHQDLLSPQLIGRQTDVPKTEDVRRPQFSKSVTGNDPREQNSSQSQEASKPAANTGDLTLGKPEDATQPVQPRPRTLKEAYEQMANRLPGLTMKQDGGAERKARVPSFDVKVTGFGDYDERFIETVSHNWWNLLDSQQFAMDRTGKVVLIFRLNSDGSITQMRFAENTVGDLLGYVCEKAVLDGAPYERWTEDMRLKLGEYSDVEFTFDYY
jgi:hypothetical protein